LGGGLDVDPLGVFGEIHLSTSTTGGWAGS